MNALLMISSEPVNINGRGPLPKSEVALVRLAIELHRACCLVEASGFADGGASNFDSLQISSRRNKLFEAALTGVGFHWEYRTGPARYVIDPIFGGQGFRRTYQCQAMRVAAICHNVAANVDYVMD